MESIETNNENIFTITVNSDSDDNLVKNKLPILLKSKKLKAFRLKAFYYLQDFTYNVNIAGFKFLGEEGRSLPERICCSILIIIAITLSSILVYQSYEKWQTSPVIVTFATSPTPIYKIPFPAVTICPETKVDMAIYNFTDMHIKVRRKENLTEAELKAYDAFSIVCNQNHYDVNESAYYFNEDRLPLLLKSVPRLYNIAQFFWQDETPTYSQKNITPIFTSEGVCYTFNGLSRSEIFNDQVAFPEGLFQSTDHKNWMLESIFNGNHRLENYPKRTFVAGQEGGLFVRLFELLQNLDHVCGDVMKGFKVAVHNPAEVPRLDSNYFRVGINKAVLVVVTPIIVKTREKLNRYSSRDRQCYLEGEKKLDFFKIYNQNNCLLECLTKFILRACGCVEFYMPRVNSTRICGLALQVCILRAKTHFMTTKIINNKLRYGKTVFHNYDDYEETTSDQCDCLPSCHSLDFVVHVSDDIVNFADYNKVMKKIDDDFDDDPKNKYYITHMHIYFKDMEFTTSERNELYVYSDFWGNVGGILGLFTGFSFITLFQILYYLSVRLMCNVKIFGKRFWSGAPG